LAVGNAAGASGSTAASKRRSFESLVACGTRTSLLLALRRSPRAAQSGLRNKVVDRQGPPTIVRRPPGKVVFHRAGQVEEFRDLPCGEVVDNSNLVLSRPSTPSAGCTGLRCSRARSAPTWGVVGALPLQAVRFTKVEAGQRKAPSALDEGGLSAYCLAPDFGATPAPSVLEN
jgi:hypothetical protein